MKVTVRFKNEDWKRDLQEAALNTIGKTVAEGKPLTEELFRRYLLTEHSPIRAVDLRITLHDILYFTSVHFARHTHAVHYVTTHSPDRTKKERTLEDKCTHIMDMNPQCLIDMARKRLCSKAAADTVAWMKEIRAELIRNGGYFKVLGESLVPNCVYRNGCPEFKPCGFFKNGNILQRYADYNG